MRYAHSVLWAPCGRIGAVPRLRRMLFTLAVAGVASTITPLVDTTPAFQSGTPASLFPFRQYRPVYDVDRKGQRFLMLKVLDTPPGQHHFVVNWFEELRRRAPADAN